MILPAPRRMTPAEMRRGLETRTLHGARPRKHTYELLDSRPGRPPLFLRVIRALDGGLFYPDERIPVFIRLCENGLAEVSRLDYTALRNLIYERTWLHPSAPIWWCWKRRPDFCWSFEVQP